MERNGLIGVVMALVIGVIMLGSVLSPVISDATATEKTYNNEDTARYQMKALEVGDRWERTNKIWSYDDEFISNYQTFDYSVLFTDNLALREAGSVKGTGYSTGSNAITSAESVVVDETGVGLQFNDTETSFEYTWGYGAVPEGNLIMKTRESSSYVLKDTEMYLTGMTQLVSGSDNSQVIISIVGNIEDGFTVTAYPVRYGTATDITVGEITINATEVEEAIDLYKFTGISFDITATYGEDSVTVPAIYSSFVLPKTVTAELSNHLDSGEIAILGSVMVIFIASLVIIGVRSFTGRND